MGQLFRVGEWTVHPDQNLIVRGTERVRVEPRAMQLLVHLAERRGEVARRNAILDAVWGDQFLTDEALTNAVAKLRRALGDDPKEPRYIQTVPQVGYRLIAAEVAEKTSPAAEGPARERTRWLAAAVAALVLGVIGLSALAGFMRAPRRDVTVDFEQTRPVPITSYPGGEFSPALSPDGGRLAFSMGQDIYVQNVTGGSPLRLTATEHAESSPSWTPDGQHISFIRRAEGRFAIYSVPALGGTETLVTSASRMFGVGVGMSWSPDGNRLAYVDAASGGEEGPLAIFLLETTTGQRSQLTHPSATDLGDRYPSFSPDGERIAFARVTERSHFSDVYVKELAGGVARRLTTDDRAVIGVEWASDGDSIVFSSDRIGPARLYRVPLSGGEPRVIARVEGRALTPTISREPPRLAYRQHLADHNIWRAPGPNGDGDAVAEGLFGSSRQDRLAAYSPDGARIAFASDRTGHWEIWLCAASGRDPERLTRFNAFAAFPNWSPDGKAIAFHARLDDHLDVYRLELGASVPTRLTMTRSNDAAPSWARDGQSIYFNSDRTGTHQVFEMSTEGDDVVQLTSRGGVAPVESFDGAAVYYTVPNDYGLWRVPKGGGPEVRFIDSVIEGLWTLVERGVVFYDDQTQAFLLHDSSSGSTTPLGTQARGLWNGVSVSPDGRWFLYSQNDAPGSDIVMLEPFR